MTDHGHEPEVYEESDWESRPIKIAAASAAVFLALSLVAASFTVRWVTKHRAETDEPTIFEAHRLPPTPRLQTDEPGDYRRFREHENELLNTYSWIDQPQGVVRLPIERAMELTVQELGGKRK